MLKSDVIADIYFYETEKNGRKEPTCASQFGCIFIIDNKKYECRLLLNEIGSIYPGENKKNIPIKFLSFKSVFENLKIGEKFYLWDMRNIAEGTIREIRKNGN